MKYVRCHVVELRQHFQCRRSLAFLSFLPMLPRRSLLNNLLTMQVQLAIPTDRVDVEALARTAAWDWRYIRASWPSSAD